MWPWAQLKIRGECVWQSFLCHRIIMDIYCFFPCISLFLIIISCSSPGRHPCPSWSMSFRWILFQTPGEDKCTRTYEPEMGVGCGVRPYVVQPYSEWILKLCWSKWQRRVLSATAALKPWGGKLEAVDSRAIVEGRREAELRGREEVSWWHHSRTQIKPHLRLRSAPNVLFTCSHNFFKKKLIIF